MNIHTALNRIAQLACIVAVFFVFGVSFASAQAGPQNCQVTSAEWRTASNSNLNNFFIPADTTNPPYIYLDVQTQGCVGETLKILFHTLRGPGIVDEFEDILFFTQNYSSLNNLDTIDSGFNSSVWNTTYIYEEDLGSTQINIDSQNQNFTVSMQTGLAECYEPFFFDPSDVAFVDTCNVAFVITMQTNINSYESYFDGYIDIDESATSFAGLSTQEQQMVQNTIATSFYPKAFLTDTTNFYDQFYANGPVFNYKCPDLAGSNNCDDEVLFGQPQIIGYQQYSNSDPEFVVVPLSEQTGIDYTPLSQGLPGFDTGEEIGFGQFLAIIFNVLLIAAGVLAFVMLIIGAFQYMSIDSISGKEDGKEKMLNALLGLLLALGAWVILNTINPQLTTNLGVNITAVQLTVDQQNYQFYEAGTAQNADSYTLAGTYQDPAGSASLETFITNLQGGISSITVDTSGQTLTVFGVNSQGSQIQASVPVTGLGAQGVAEVGQGVPGDRKTPKGVWNVSSSPRISSNQNDAILSSLSSSTGQRYNMGAAFINTGATDQNGNNRAIGIHGNKSNTPGATMGCIRISNDNLLLIAPRVSAGIQVTIN